MTEIIVTRGLPASGKSTWAKAWVAADPSSRLRVNRDDIRHMLYGKYWGEGVDEAQVSAVEESIVRAGLKAGKSVVVDATHLKAAYIKKWYALGPEVTVKEFPVPIDQLLDRDHHRRAYGERGVGHAVILDMAKRFGVKNDGTLPRFQPPVTTRHEFAPYVPGKLKAYSFDIDGTLLHMGDRRGPYDTSLYHLDTPDNNLVRMLWDLQDYASRGPDYIAFIGLSGRNEDHRDVTEESLRGWGISLDDLYMRPSDQPTTNDAIVKSDLVDKYISNVYDVVMHFDDRNRVVDALRAKGMKVAQVEPGDF